MNNPTLRPYRVRRSESDVTAIEWDMQRDPLSPESLIELLTYGQTKPMSVGFDCVEQIVLAIDEDDAKSIRRDMYALNGVINSLLRDRDRKMSEIVQLKSRLSILTRSYNENLKSL